MIASIAASIIKSGVLKSGSPKLKPIKSLQLDNNNILKINSVSDYSKDFKLKKFLRPSDPESFTSNRY
ncbi:MAG: hypothetical protein ABF286_04970, partial [Polaribacter sp.]